MAEELSGKQPKVVSSWEEVEGTNDAPVVSSWEEAEGLKKKEPTTLEAGGTSTSALDGGKSASSTPNIPTWKDNIPGAPKPAVKAPVSPTPAVKNQKNPNAELYKKYEFTQSQYKKANEEANIFNSTFPESGVKSKNLPTEFISEYESGKKKISENLNQKKAIADVTRKEISEKINTDVDRIYSEYGKDLMQKSAIGKSVANKEKIQEISKEEARKFGLPENGYFATLLKTQLSAKAEWEEIKPEVERKFNEIYKKKYGSLPSDDQQKEFSSQLAQLESIKAKAKVAINKLASEASANAELPIKELGDYYKSSIDELNKSIDADPEISQYQTDVVNSIVGQYQELVNSGKMTIEQASEFLKSEDFSREVLSKTNQMVTDKYGAQFNQKYADYLKQLNEIKTKYNSQFVRQQQEVLTFANKEIEKEYKKIQKEYKPSPELQKKYKEAYADAYKEVSEKKLRSEASIVEAQDAMVPFYTSTLSSLGSAFKGMGTAFGLSGFSDFGERLEASYATPDVGIKKFSDIFDATKFSVSSGQLLGRMTPGVAVGFGTAITTRNIPLAAQLAATGFAGWAAETSDMVGTMYNEVLEDTGDAAKANNAANKMLEAQTYMMPTYALEGLPFFGKALKAVPTVLGRATVGAGIEFGTEMIQEIPQGAFEEAIKAGDDLGDFSKYITWEKSKQTMLQMAPITVLGGAPILYRGARDYGVKKYAEAQAKSYVIKNDISGFLETSPEQFLFNVHNAKGTAFSKAFVSLMYSNGNISADEMTKLTEKVELFDEYKELLKKSKIKTAPEQVGFRVFSEYQEAKKDFESEKNEDAKDILSERLKTKKQDYQDFFAGKGVNLVALKMPNGEEYVFSPEEMNEALKYENIRNSIKNKEIGISVYAKKGQEAVMKSVSDSMEIIFQEAENKPTLTKFTNPTDEMYGTVNRNDGKGEVTLTKEEFLKESGANVLISDTEAKEAIEAQRKQRDLEIEEFAAIRPDLTDEDMLIMDIPEMVDKTIDRMDANIPTDPIQVEESIAALDKKFEQLQAYKNDPKRTHTIAQIDEVIDLLSEAKTELQSYQAKNNEYESRTGQKTEAAKAKPETKVGETIKSSEGKEGVESGTSNISEPVAKGEVKADVGGVGEVAVEAEQTDGQVAGQELGQKVGQEVEGKPKEKRRFKNLKLVDEEIYELNSQGLKRKEWASIRNVFRKSPEAINVPNVFDEAEESKKFLEENKPNTKEELVVISDLTPAQNLLKKDNITDRKDKGDLPIVLKIKDKFYVYDGHHRIASEYLNGENKIKAKVISLPDSYAPYDFEQSSSNVSLTNEGNNSEVVEAGGQKGSEKVENKEESSVYFQGIPKTTSFMQALLDENGEPLVQGSLEDVEKYKRENGIDDTKVNFVDLDVSNPNSLINKFRENKTPKIENKGKAIEEKPLSEQKGENKVEKEGLKDVVSVKQFAVGDGGTKGVFISKDGKLYKSIQPQSIQQTDKGFERRPIEGETTNEFELLSDLQDNPNIPKIGNIVETSEGPAFEIERLDEIEKYTPEEYSEIVKILDDLNNSGYHVGDKVTVMRRPKTKELVVVDFSSGYKDSRQSKDSQDYMMGIESKMSKSDAAVVRYNRAIKFAFDYFNDFGKDSIFNEPKIKGFRYKMKMRPFGIGTYPKEGFEKFVSEGDKKKDGYYAIIEYSKPLSENDIKSYELEYDGQNGDIYNLTKVVEELISKQSPKPKTNEKGNQEAEGREKGLLSPKEETEPVSSEPPVFERANDLANWNRENIPNFELSEDDMPMFIAENSNDPLEIIDAYVRASEKNKSSEANEGSALLKRALSIEFTKTEFDKHFGGNLKQELKSGPIAMIKRLHVRSSMGVGGGRKFQDLKEELDDLAKEGMPFENESAYIDFLLRYYQNPSEVKNEFQAYAESKEMKVLADAYEDRGFGKRLNDKRVLEYLTENAYEKLGVREKKLVNQLEAKTYEEAEQWFYDRIKSGEFTLDADAPTGVVKRIKADREREAEQQRAVAEAEERRQLNTPRNAIDVAKIFRNDFGFTPWEAVAAARMFDAKARLFSRILGLTREQYYQRYWLTSQSQDGGMDQETRKGSWSKEAAYAKRIIGMYKKANSTTAIHEILGHDYFDNIIAAAELGDKQSIEDLNTIVEEYIKEKKPKLSKGQVLKIVKEFNVESNNTDAGREVHEWFAKAAERYFASGDNLKPEIANSKLGRLFEKFRQHVAELYQAAVGSLIPPSPEMKKVFRRLFGEENFEVLENNDRVIQQAKEDSERVPATQKASSLVGKLPVKNRSGLSQDEMTPEQILLEAAKDLIQNNESDKYNIVRDLKALVYKETGSKDYWPDIDDLKEQLEDIDKPDEGKIFNATVERALADRNVSPEIKRNLRSKDIRERDTYSLLKQISDSADVVNMVGPETIANLLLEEEGKTDKQFEDYEFVTLASIAAKRLNAMKKAAPTAQRRAELTNLTTELYDKVSQKGSGISRALNSYRAWNLLDAEGMMLIIRRKMNKDNGKDVETAKQRAKKMQAELEQLKKDFDYAFTGMLDSEEVRGRLEEEIAELNKKIEELEKRKGQRAKADSKTGKPITKGREFTPKFGIPEVKDFFKNKFKPGLSQDEVTEDDFKEAVADLLSKQKDYSFPSFIKAFNAQMGEKYTARDLRELYDTTVDYMTDNGYEGGFSDAVNVNEIILDETLEADAAAAIVQRDLLVQHEKAMKAYMEKQRKAFIEDVANKMNNRELWEQYINSVTGELVSKVAQNLGQGGIADKALLDEFTSLVKNAIKEKLDEVLPVAKGQPVQKTAKELAENISDLANNEEKFADVFDAVVEKLQEKYKGDVNAIQALQALANIQNPFSEKLLSKAVSKQFERTGWKLGDVAFGRGTGLMANQMAQQVLSDGGLIGTPAEAVLRPLLEDAFKKNAKQFEDKTLDSLANYIVNDAKRAVGAVSPERKTFVDEMIGALKRKVREQYKVNNKTAPADPLDLIKFALREQGKADQVGGSLWGQAQAEVIAKINADPKLTPSQKQDAIKFLKEFSNSVFDTIVPASTLERAIVREIKKSGIALDANGGIPWEELIKGVDGQIESLRALVERAIRAEMGNSYNPALVDMMVDRITDKYDSMIAEKKQALFEKQLASFSSPVSMPFVRDRRIGGMVGKLMAMEKSGLLDAKVFNDLVSEYMGLATLTAQEWNELEYLLRQIEEAPEGFERVTAIEDVTLFLESKQPMYGAKVMRAIYYANLLSGFSTAIKNLTGIFDVMIMAVARSAREGDAEYFKKFKQGLSQGDFGDIIRRGSANQGDKVDVPTDSMGLAHVNTLERWRKYPGLRNKVFGSLAYVSRVLNATDAAVQRSVQEQSDYYLTKKELRFKNPGLSTKAIRSMALENMFRDDVTFEEAVEQAVDEMNARGLRVDKQTVLAELNKSAIKQSADTVRARRRAYEIMKANRSAEVRMYSGKDALKTAFKTEYKDNKGVFTFIGNKLMALFQGIGGGFSELGEILANQLNVSEAKKKAIKESFEALPQTLIMPIIRGVSNVAEVSAEKLPFYGIPKGAFRLYDAISSNNRNFKALNKAMTTQERVEFEYQKMQAKDMITTSIASTVLVGVITAMLMEAVPDDDEEVKNDFYAAGSRLNMAKKGQKAKMVVFPENSLVIGGEIFSFSWFGTMALSLSAYANYQETKNNEDFGIADFMAGTISGFLSASMFEPVSRISEVISPKFKTEKTKGELAADWALNIGKSALVNTFMPWSNMQAQMAQGGQMMFGKGNAQDAIGFYEKLVKGAPILNLIPGVGYDRPSLDYVGDPIPLEVKNPGGAASLFQWAQDRKIPAYKVYDAQIGLNTPFNGKSLDNTIVKETMTDEDYYDYRKDVSKAFKPFQEDNFKHLSLYSTSAPTNSNGDITLVTQKQQQEVALSMFGMSYSKLASDKMKKVNQGLNYREASERAHNSIERYYRAVYLNEMGVPMDLEEAKKELDDNIYSVLPTDLTNDERQSIADRVLRNLKR